MKTVKLINGMVVNVVYPDEVFSILTNEDKEMDARACEAVCAAIAKAEFLSQFK